MAVTDQPAAANRPRRGLMNATGSTASWISVARFGPLGRYPSWFTRTAGRTAITAVGDHSGQPTATP